MIWDANPHGHGRPFFLTILSRLAMQTLFYMLSTTAVGFWVVYFWFRVGRWVYLNGRDVHNKVERFRRVVAGVYKNEV